MTTGLLDRAPARAQTRDDEAVAWLAELVRMPSVSGSERAACEVFARAASTLGLEAWIDEAGNAIARRPASSGLPTRRIVLLGHIDTVAGAIPVRMEGGVLHGRGSVDAKGPLAAMLFAACRAELPADVEVTVVGAVGEETAGSPGARHLLRTMERPDACIIAEPSGWDGVTLGYKGRLIVRARIGRDCAHGAGPEGSACDALLGWWERVTQFIRVANDPLAPVFEQVQASVAAMGSDGDGLRARAELRCGFRLPEWMAPERLERELARLAGDSIELEFAGRERAWVTDRNDPVVRALTGAVRAEGGRPRPKRKTGTADLNVVGPVWGCPIAAYGPGDSALDHAPDERLEIAEYLRAIRVAARAITTLATERTRTDGRA